ncbi:MAG: hypothetical protein R2879_16060 [Saprospiraceae bacterium]
MRWTLIIFLALVFQPAFSQLSVSASLDTNAMLIGDQLHLRLDIESTGSERIQKVLYEQADTSKKVKWIRSSRLINNGNQYTQEIVFTVFDSGYYAFDPLKVVYAQGNQLDTALSGTLAFKVDNPPQDSTGLLDIKPIVEEPRTFEDFIPYLIGLGVVLAFFLLYRVIRRFQKGKPEKEPEPEVIRPAGEVALEKLEQLTKAQLWQKGEVKSYYSEVSFILREFIENRFDFPAIESTTYEIRKKFKGSMWQKLDLASLYEILEVADLVKFAKSNPDAEMHQKVLDKAYQFVLDAKEDDEDSSKEA